MGMRMIIAFAILVCIAAAGSVLALDASDLVFYFPFEEFDGDNALDQSGNGHNGTINGDIQLVDGGKRGKAAQFAKTSFIDMDGPNIPEDHIPRDEVTLCGWAKCEKTGDHHTFFNARASDATWVIHPELRSEGNFRWLLRSDGGATMFDIRAGSVDWDEWIHYAGVYDGKKAVLYINGKSVAEQAASGKVAKDWGMGARIGYDIDNERPFTGLMDDLCMWKKALTQEEIRILMERGPEVLIEGEALSSAGNLATTWGELKGG
jgi:hypothetical protein